MPTRPRRRHAQRFAVTPARLAPLAALAAAASPALAGGPIDFAMVEGSSDSVTAVLVSALGDPRAADPPPLLSASYTRWSDGQAGGIGIVKRWSFPADAHTALLGVGAGANGFSSRAPGDSYSESALSLRLQAEAFGPAPGGNYYALVQASSFRNGWLASAQYAPAEGPVAFELSHYAETGYHASTAIVRIATGVEGWSLRLGAVNDLNGTRALLGISYNGF
jgi:hypothetical protein